MTGVEKIILSSYISYNCHEPYPDTHKYTYIHTCLKKEKIQY